MSNTLPSSQKGPPQEHPLAADPPDHLVQLPPPSRLRPQAPQVPGELHPEHLRPDPDRLIAYLDPALGQQILDIPEAEREPEI
jgi:hypothetical protein